MVIPFWTLIQRIKKKKRLYIEIEKKSSYRSNMKIYEPEPSLEMTAKFKGNLWRYSKLALSGVLYGKSVREKKKSINYFMVILEHAKSKI